MIQQKLFFFFRSIKSYASSFHLFKSNYYKIFYIFLLCLWATNFNNRTEEVFRWWLPLCCKFLTCHQYIINLNNATLINRESLLMYGVWKKWFIPNIEFNSMILKRLVLTWLKFSIWCIWNITRWWYLFKMYNYCYEGMYDYFCNSESIYSVLNKLLIQK